MNFVCVTGLISLTWSPLYEDVYEDMLLVC